MKFLDIADLIIPGYQQLEEKQRSTFENTLAGSHFVALVTKYTSAFTNLQNSVGFLNLIWGNLEQKKETLQQEFIKDKQALLTSIKKTRDFINIQMAANNGLLEIFYTDINLLDDAAKIRLLQADFTQTFLHELVITERRIAQANAKMDAFDPGTMNIAYLDAALEKNRLLQRKDQLIERWLHDFNNHPALLPLKNAIDEQKNTIKKEAFLQQLHNLNQRALEIADFFPMLQHPILKDQPSALKQLQEALNHLEDTNEEPNHLFEQTLKEVVFYCLQSLSSNAPHSLQLMNFNQAHALKMAGIILNQFDAKQPLAFEALLQEYSVQLTEHIAQMLQTIDGKTLTNPNQDRQNQFTESLAFLWNNPAVQQANRYIGKLADAHGFIQATNFSTQNENSLLAVLDLYNYARFYENIAENKTIFSSLMKPFLPIYFEYRDIGLYEHNQFWKIIRTLLPIIITVGCIVIIAALLTPLALPELAFAAVLIPSIIIGLDITTLYVSVKNNVYKTIRDNYYGGPFEIPEFQLNQRMLKAFYNEENAEVIRKFYIQELQQCDDIETTFRSQYEQGVLSTEDLAARKENLTRRNTLLLEWYDVHSNNDLGCDESKHIAIHRIQRTCFDQYQRLQSTVQQDIPLIHAWVSQLLNKFEALLTTLQSVNSPEESVEPLEKLVHTVTSDFSFFKPFTSGERKAQIERLWSAQERIEMTIQSSHQQDSSVSLSGIAIAQP